MKKHRCRFKFFKVWYGFDDQNKLKPYYIFACSEHNNVTSRHFVSILRSDFWQGKHTFTRY